MALTNLALWLSQRYSKYATPLEWTEDSFNQIVEDTLELLGVESEDEKDDYTLHVVGSYTLLKQAKRDITFIVNKFSADGGSYDLNLEEKINSDLSTAFNEASPYLDDEQTISVDWGEIKDPYQYTEDRDNAGNF